MGMADVINSNLSQLCIDCVVKLKLKGCVGCFFNFIIILCLKKQQFGNKKLVKSLVSIIPVWFFFSYGYNNKLQYLLTKKKE